MRGKTAILTFHAEGISRDSMGRRVQATDTGTAVAGTVSPPSATKSRGDGEATVDLDAVAFVPAGSITITDGMWVTITDGPTEAFGGDFIISRWSGGVKVIRLELRRRDTRDGAHGTLV